MKRVISIFLIFVLCLSFLPVFAEGNEDVSTSLSIEISENIVKGIAEFTDNSETPLVDYDAVAVLSFINYDKTAGAEVTSTETKVIFSGRKGKLEVSAEIPENAENIEFNVYNNMTDKTPLCDKKMEKSKQKS